MVKSPDGKYPYKNIFDALGKTVKNEGVGKLWVGFPTYYFRIAPHAMMTWIIMGIINDVLKPNKTK